MVSLLIVLVVLCAIITGLLVYQVLRSPPKPDLSVIAGQLTLLAADVRRTEQNLPEMAALGRKEHGSAIGTLREELDRKLGLDQEALVSRIEVIRREMQAFSESIRQTVESRLREASESMDTRLGRLRIELSEAAGVARSESRDQMATFQLTVKEALGESRASQSTQLSDFAIRLKEVGTVVSEQLDRVRQTLELRLTELQAQNAVKLDEMRMTVDQRLQATLEQRLGESFKVVSESLERVTRGLGEMQQIAAGVGDLKRVLTNVKTRGTWSEVQLSALLDQMLTPDQFSANVQPNPASDERVEFAVKLPGKELSGKPVWLPIDAKFPVEDYQRLVDAADRADTDAVNEAVAALDNRFRACARDISQKYLSPPYTTDFGIMFLPTEGLYAEALRRPGLADALQREHRIVIAGPTTLAALLNSLQMGFKTLAIQQRSSEVWNVLAGVKTEFGKFGEVLAKVKRKLDEASSQIDQTGVRSRAIERKLKNVETLSPDEAGGLSFLPPAVDAPSEEEEAAS